LGRSSMSRLGSSLLNSTTVWATAEEITRVEETLHLDSAC
jgi:hypothetical protein